MNDYSSLVLTYGTCVAVVLLFAYRLAKLYRAKCTRDGDAFATILSKYQTTIGKIIPQKTLFSAKEFFTLENWYAAYNINYRHISATASSLVGLGIFGTFLGLAISLGQITLDGKEQEITNSIQHIMGGINTAFYSSVCGMLLSLVFALLHRQHVNNIQKQLTEWSEVLDAENYTDQVQLVAEQTLAIKSFGEAIGTNVGNQVAKQLETSLTELIETVTDCIKEQMQSAGQYMSDSANELRESAVTLQGVTSSIKESTAGLQSLLKSVDKSMSAISATIAKVEAVQESFGDTASEMGDSAIQLKSSIISAKETITVLDNKFSVFNSAMIKVENSLNAMQATYASLGGHSSKLDEQYRLVSSLIGKLEGNMERQNAEFYKSLTALEKTIGEVPNLKPDIEAIFERINDGLKAYVDLLQNQTSGLLSTYTQEFTKACQSIQSTTGQLSSIMEEGTLNLTQAVKESALLMSEAASKLQK